MNSNKCLIRNLILIVFLKSIRNECFERLVYMLNRFLCDVTQEKGNFNKTTFN